MHTLTLIRHAKSDWSTSAGDHDRPLAARGRAQAPETGTWLAAELPPVDLAVVSTAARAMQTWELVADELPGQVRAMADEDLYTFDGEDVLEVVRSLPATARHAVVVGHNPAMEEAIRLLTGEGVRMRTSSLAVVEIPGEWAQAGDQPGRLIAAGRPATDQMGR
ncbi:MAG: histidine phosphatase family protein [Micrococcales bacterium]|nr:histidine phosphatase family protein [Micrococcales bacterium]